MPLIVVLISENARNDVNAAIGRYTAIKTSIWEQ